MNTKTHTDIKPDGWLISTLPPLLRPFALLARIDRPAGIWLLLLPGWWAIVLASGGVRNMYVAEWKIFVLFGLGAAVMRAAGCVINDLWDRDLDRHVERTKLRPLASGAVSVRQAAGFLFVLLAIGFVILLQMNFVTIALGILSLPLIVIYPLMKRFTWWPQLFLGLTFNFGALMGWSAVTGEIGIQALWLYIGGILWTLGYDTIYAHQDKEDDALAGVKSTARLFDEDSRYYVSRFMGASWGALAISTMGWQCIFLLPAMAHQFWQLKNWNENDAQSSLRVFRSNRDFGLLILAGLAV